MVEGRVHGKTRPLSHRSGYTTRRDHFTSPDESNTRRFRGETAGEIPSHDPTRPTGSGSLGEVRGRLHHNQPHERTVGRGSQTFSRAVSKGTRLGTLTKEDQDHTPGGRL